MHVKPNTKYNRRTGQNRHWLFAALLMSIATQPGASPQNAFAEVPETIGILPTRLPSVNASIGNEDKEQKHDANVVKQPRSINVPVVHSVPAKASLPTDVARQKSAGSAPRQTDWLRSGTSSATVQVARRSLDQANAEFRVGAWLSAETSAWEALRLAAESIDQFGQESGQRDNSGRPDLASSDLKLARQAMIEARDFSTTFEAPDPQAISRIARSHQTKVLQGEATDKLLGTDVSDRYLDFARIHFATIASRSVEAAEAMDLLAAIYMRRADAKTLPSPTALCLRRAAIQGQPDNASLASNLGIHLSRVGLYREAEWALQHSLAIQPNPVTTDALVSLLTKTGRHAEANAMVASAQNTVSGIGSESKIRVPEITELSPEEFASLSKSVVWPDDGPKLVAPSSIPERTATLASARIPADPSNAANVTAQPVIAVSLPETSSPIQRLKNSWKRLTE